MSAIPVLWHLRDSHYNEKARWALDHKRLPHRRRAALPGSHPLVGAILTRGRSRTLPVLVHDGRAIGDSTEIIAELDRIAPERPLIPADPDARARALALEEDFDSELAPQLRRFVLWNVLNDPPTVDRMVGPYTDPMTRRAMPFTLPPLRSALFRTYGITEEAALDGRRRTLAALDRLEAEIGPGGHLVGDGFTVADLTGAAMLGPLLRPPGYPYPAFSLPAPLAELRDEIAARPAGAWMRDTYARHREASTA